MPTRAATSLDQTPAVQTTVSVLIRPSVVSTPRILLPRTGIRVTSTPCLIRTPFSAAAAA